MNITGHISSSSFAGKSFTRLLALWRNTLSCWGKTGQEERLSEDYSKNIMCLWPVPRGSLDFGEPLKRTTVVSWDSQRRLLSFLRRHAASIKPACLRLHENVDDVCFHRHDS